MRKGENVNQGLRTHPVIFLLGDGASFDEQASKLCMSCPAHTYYLFTITSYFFLVNSEEVRSNT